MGSRGGVPRPFRNADRSRTDSEPSGLGLYVHGRERPSIDLDCLDGLYVGALLDPNVVNA